MQGISEDVLLVAEFHHLAEVHNSDLVGNELDDRKVVRYEEVGQVHRALKVLEQIDDLRLDRNVECRNGLVADDKLGFYGKCARDADTLTLTARKFVGVALVVIVAQTAFFHKVENVILDLILRNYAVNEHGLGEYVADRCAGRERGIRVLEDDLHLGSQIAQVLTLELCNVLTLEVDLAAARGMEAENGASESGLAASRLADNAERFARLQLEGYVINRNKLLCGLAHKGLCKHESLLEITDFKYRLGIGRIFLDFFRHLFLLLSVEVAGNEVRRADLNHTGVITRAFRDALVASFLEIAMSGHIYGVRNVAGDVE